VRARLLGLAGPAAIAAVVAIAVWLALRSGAGRWAVVYGGVVAVAAYVATRTQTPQDKISDAGRGVVVGILLALVANSISHRDAVRNARDSLRLTLSSGKIFTGIDLRGRPLSNAYIGGKHLSKADLRGAHLANAVLQHSTLRETDFHGSKTDLSNADLSFADLSEADLRLVNLEGADLTEANLRGARLAGAHLRGATLEGAHLDRADLRGADLRSAVMLGTHLQGALLNDADLRGTVLRGDFRPAELDGAALRDVHTSSETLWPVGFDLDRAVAETSAPPPTKVEIPPDAAHDVVTWVSDGDTIKLRGLGPVRLLGLDAPTKERPTACHGPEATEALRQRLPVGTSVVYKLGSTGEDDFHRKVAFVWLPSGTFLNGRIVADGDATFMPLPHKKELPEIERFYGTRLKRLAIRAAMNERGLWGSCSATEG
jgi:uncharacterized protein YjbI with pentapeptide repeats/endonuclease YncB( thermonuclease family)